MDEWTACVDAITFIFQARTIPINNEKERKKLRVRKKIKNKRARHIIYIYMHTSRSRNSESEFMGMCVWLMNGTCEDYQN
mgnify:CR=1 FL=1